MILHQLMIAPDPIDPWQPPMPKGRSLKDEYNILILRTFTLTGKYNLGANPNFIVRCLDELN